MYKSIDNYVIAWYSISIEKIYRISEKSYPAKNPAGRIQQNSRNKTAQGW